MQYTVRYAHLSKALVKEGDDLGYGVKIGVMGNTGQSTGPHLHIDCVEGESKKLHTLKEVLPISSPLQLNYFIDKDLFDCLPVVTTWYMDYRYPLLFGKQHPAYDVVPEKTNKTTIRWNRSKVGKVVKVDYDEKGYGNYVLVSFFA